MGAYRSPGLLSLGSSLQVAFVRSIGQEGPQGPGGLRPICVGASFVLSAPESIGPCTSFSPPHSKEGNPRLLT
ncbi:UNVERIFIED_CONTAM: hypothetical protein Slati_3500900 [Sesamum latifolium]|uniref:Uncharacterized protein n=1 Tax=Sesamum latifolium TaxID=2727402 RepID=A0AAW2UIG3_9LAMI